MPRQLHCIIHPKNQRQYYAMRDDGVVALYEISNREPLVEYSAAKALLTYAGYENMLVTDTDGNQENSQQMNDTLPYEKDYTMEILWPWLSVFQQYGTNGCVYNLENETVRVFCRENYHAEVSSFSNGLLIHSGHVCLLHQTQWNRLDITDLETGCLLTEREIYYRYDEPDERGNRHYEKKNYRDYFHGKVFFSPDYKYFVDTGWVWQPVGVPTLYCLEDFITGYENSGVNLTISDDNVYGDDWDQSAVWLDNHRFLVNYCPSLDFIDEEGPSAKSAQGLLLQFDVTQTKPVEAQDYKKELLTEKILLLPFVPTKVLSYYPTGERTPRYYGSILNVELYWDAAEQLLIGANGSDLSVFDMVSEVGYCIRCSAAKCFYSVLHHTVYQLSPWPGNLECWDIRGLLKAAIGFRFEHVE